MPDDYLLRAIQRAGGLTDDEMKEKVEDFSNLSPDEKEKLASEYTEVEKLADTLAAELAKHSNVNAIYAIGLVIGRALAKVEELHDIEKAKELAAVINGIAMNEIKSAREDRERVYGEDGESADQGQQKPH